MPYEFLNTAPSATSPDGRGVILFGGKNFSTIMEKSLLELRAGADSWKLLDTTLQNGRIDHVVIPLTSRATLVGERGGKWLFQVFRFCLIGVFMKVAIG